MIVILSRFAFAVRRRVEGLFLRREIFWANLYRGFLLP